MNTAFPYPDTSLKVDSASSLQALVRAGKTPLNDYGEMYLDRERCKPGNGWKHKEHGHLSGFGAFVHLGWHVLEPVTKLKWGWAFDAMCEHLEAVTYGEIKRLLMNVPPGHMKSLLTGVFWPAWEWGPAGLPHMRYLGTAHKEPLATRDNVKCRRLVQSQWFQDRWPTKLVGDQNAKTKFENTSTGFRESMAFQGMTGSRGDRVLLDDPHSVDQANSKVELENDRTTFNEALPSRVNDEESAIIVIMQRLNVGDISGLILEKGLGYEHLMLPMHYDEARTCVTVMGSIDERRPGGKHEGEILLSPDRFPKDQVDALAEQLGSYAAAGQLEQQPVPREGGLFKREWFKDKIIAHEDIPFGTQWVRHWDLAATTSVTAARTAGVRIGKTPDGRFIVSHVRKAQKEGHQVRLLILDTADEDGHDTRISLPQDPGQAGKVQKQDFAAMLSGRLFSINIESGDKETRAEPFSAQCEAGNVYLVRGEWVSEYLDELCLFPGGKFADQVDASSGAFGQLVLRPRAKTTTGTRS